MRAFVFLIGLCEIRNYALPSDSARECGERVIDDEDLAAHLYGDKFALPNEARDVFRRQA